MFGSLEWSSSEDRILFIAERYRPKAASYFDKNDKSSESSSYVRGAEHLFFEEWGELLTKHHCPVPVIFSLETKDCQAVDCDLSVGQALWGPHDDSLIFIGWDNEPRRLGLIFCSNRKSAVYLYNLQDLKLEELSGADLSVTSPRLNSDKTKLVYLGNIVGGPHKSCMRLMMLDLGTRETVTLVDIVNSPEGGFPGLYVDALPSRCWSSDDSKIIFSSIWQSKQEILCVDISSASVFKISPDGVAGCWSVLDVFDDLVTCSFASPSSPSRLMIGLLGEPQAGSSIQIEGMTTIASSYGNFENDLSWEIIKLKPSVGDSRIFYEAVLIRPVQTDDVKPPLIVTPHGGPHSCAVADFSVSTTTLCLLGFAVLLVNYRGSIGFGQDSIDALLGNIGKIDVCDVQDAAVNVIQSGVVDPTRILVHGGSHGGFLSCHLIGQFPEFYKAACVRNPVTNIAAMVGVSDIPDWCHTEVGLLYNVWTTVSTADTLTKMINVSPIRYADKVKTPILFLVGAQDLRVPPPQSHEMHYALKARHVRTKMLVYDKSSHPLMEVDVEADAFVNMVLWFYDHLSSVKKI
ncbi:acylamino-acid-releasing enzyme-like isoform X2 [Corticium candelabrum]|uniref:acylamino-acid-releasing enzyme-like isoform X2 n=1 Tax=Corticium candelabrum TaxID=121492 RepID=UPI002E265ABA|nr:acylamino-acid-releasing enzyme-like isoform X2 [Corticium candelabrum]